MLSVDIRFSPIRVSNNAWVNLVFPTPERPTNRIEELFLSNFWRKKFIPSMPLKPSLFCDDESISLNFSSKLVYLDNVVVVNP